MITELTNGQPPSILAQNGLPILVALISSGLINLVLNHRNSAKLESFKFELEREKLKTSQVFVTTEKVIAEIYAMLVGLKSSAAALVTSDAEHEDWALGQFYKKLNEFYDAYPPKKIYIPNSTAKQISNFIDVTTIASFKWRGGENIDDTPEKIKEQNYQHVKGFFGDEGELPKLLELLESDFQRILGITDLKQNAPVRFNAAKRLEKLYEKIMEQ